MSDKPNVYQSTCPLKVALLCGGISNERTISLCSAEEVRLVLEEIGHTVVPVDTGNPHFIQELLNSDVDIAFIALHGKGGEDGTMQGLLELMGIPYIGSGVKASALAMDKTCSKHLFEAAGLMTPAAEEVSFEDLCGSVRAAGLCIEDLDEGRVHRIIEKIALPCVVKPVSEGSSVGVFIARTYEEVCQALVYGFKVAKELLIEAFVSGTEVTVSVIGNDKPFTLPVLEIVPENEFYDYESKYSEGGSRHIIPARLAPEILKTCEEVALVAHEVLGCRGVSRTDMVVSEDGTCWIIEINTIPGMTATSLLPDAALAAGISKHELYDRLLMWALEDKPIGTRSVAPSNESCSVAPSNESCSVAPSNEAGSVATASGMCHAAPANEDQQESHV